MDSQQNPQVNVFDLPRIQTQTRIEYRFHEKVDSTNDEAIKWVSSTSTVAPILILTNHQTDGRGRQGRSWDSETGSLTFSLALHAGKIETTRSLIPLAVGVSVCQAIQNVCLKKMRPITSLRIKWPNDIVINEKKAGGILIESVGSDRIIIGVGLNVNDSIGETMSNSNEGRLLKPISIRDAIGVPVALTDLVIECVNSICAILTHQDSDRMTRTNFEQISFLSNRHLEIELPGGEIASGYCHGIAPCGSLLVGEDSGRHQPIKVASGRVRQMSLPTDPVIVQNMGKASKLPDQHWK